MQTITKRILTQEHLDAGLLTNEDDHCIYLWQTLGKVHKCVAIFSIHTTLKDIWDTADKIIRETNARQITTT